MAKFAVCLLWFPLVLLTCCMQARAAPCYPAMFVFGDCLSDTGNGNLTGNIAFARAAQWPFGETYPGWPFGRLSDGRLVVDFLAMFLGLPLLQPSLDSSANFSAGVNYAVAGATALPAEELNTRLIYPLTTLSLDAQVAWHQARKAGGRPSAKAYAKGLYVIAIGGNDYIAALRSQYSVSYITTNILPLVIARIRNATEVLYANGARNFLFFSIPPLGCAPALLSNYLLDAKDISTGCLIDLNLLSNNHGTQLLALVESLRQQDRPYPATFLFADYYNSYIHILRNGATYGFSNTLEACCGGILFPYRYNMLTFCNSQSGRFLGTLCPNPNSFVNWDGVHFTDRFNSLTFELIFTNGLYMNPQAGFATCNSSYFP